MLNLDLVQQAQRALQGIARRTPLDPAPRLGDELYIKAENKKLNTFSILLHRKLYILYDVS